MNFDHLAPHYDWLEALTAGDRLQRARIHWLGALQGRRHILRAGEGHGRFAAACVARHPGSRLTCLEASAGMLARAQERTGALGGNIQWIQTDVLAWRPEARFDAVVTCLFLDCLPPEELDRIIARLAEAATPDAVWLVVDFALPAAGPARRRAQAVHWLMYRFFRAAAGLPAQRFTPPDERLQQHGFRLTGSQDFDWGLIRASVWERSGTGKA